MFKNNFCVTYSMHFSAGRARAGRVASVMQINRPCKEHAAMDECSRQSLCTSTDMTYTVYGVRGTACAAVYGCRVGIDNLYSKVKEFVRVESALCVVYRCSLCTSRSAPAKTLHCNNSTSSRSKSGGLRVMRWNVLLPSKFGSTLIIPFTHVHPRLRTVHLDLQSSLRNFQLVPRLFVVNSFSTLLIWKKMKLLLTPPPPAPEDPPAIKGNFLLFLCHTHQHT